MHDILLVYIKHFAIFARHSPVQHFPVADAHVCRNETKQHDKYTANLMHITKTYNTSRPIASNRRIGSI